MSHDSDTVWTKYKDWFGGYPAPIGMLYIGNDLDIEYEFTKMPFPNDFVLYEHSMCIGDKNLFNNMPTMNGFISDTLMSEKESCNLPLYNRCEYNNVFVKGDNRIYNGYPAWNNMFGDVVMNVPECTNFPLRHLFPLPVQTWHIANGLLEEMPITIFHNPMFINNPSVLRYSDTKYLTPKQAKLFANHFLFNKLIDMIQNNTLSK